VKGLLYLKESVERKREIDWVGKSKRGRGQRHARASKKDVDRPCSQRPSRNICQRQVFERIRIFSSLM